MNTAADRLVIFLMFIPILSLHEAAHAWVAHLLGDDTARDEGRLTLNPASHIDLWGTCIIPAVSLFIFSGALLGWGRPVPVTGSNFRNWRRDEVLVALAGPLANLLFAALLIAVTVVLPGASPWRWLTQMFAFVSLCLGLLNILPFPPFDGWSVVRTLFDVPDEWIERHYMWRTILILFIYNFTPFFRIVENTALSLASGMAHLFGGILT